MQHHLLLDTSWPWRVVPFANESLFLFHRSESPASENSGYFYPALKVTIGGQPGADRAGLNAAIEVEIEHGGWIPKGRLTEDGPLLKNTTSERIYYPSDNPQVFPHNIAAIF